ncbi:MAG TPA: hypothetical protein VEP90_30625, partial [Methylomirabilota bacterium]|nr:hypothetical protein [Methylomirabilota bacterium]
MNKYAPNDIEQLVERVRRHIEDEEIYVDERMEAFEVKRQSWLSEAIRRALISIHGFVDESLIEPIRA